MSLKKQYPKFYRALDAMIESALLNRITAVGVARRAGIRRGQSTSSGPDPVGAFTLANDALGFSVTLSGTATFPGTPSGDMTGEADLSDKSEGRIIANVAEAFGSGSTLSVSGGVIGTVAIDEAGLFDSGWASLGSGSLMWEVSGSGTGVLGLVQAQAR
jgi:hypothetical protein